MHDRKPALRIMAMPRDANPSGDIFGGWVMSQVDMAGGIIAAKLANNRVVTVAVDEFVFKQPVFVGDLVSCYGELVRVGKTSITILIEVWVERKGDNRSPIKVTEATLVYVTVYKNGRPIPVKIDE